MHGELIENRIVVWDPKESKNLFVESYYGKPIGISKPKPEEINGPLILDLIEAYYLQEKSVLLIFKKKKKVTSKQMLEICNSEYHNFDKKYSVYKDFREKKYIINPGIKFGCDFAVYQRGPGIDHAPYLVQVYNKNDSISATGIVLAGRLATSVKKNFILAVPHGEQVDYLALDWWRA
jgi:tRNA-intron endonuclease, archaea type